MDKEFKTSSMCGAPKCYCVAVKRTETTVEVRDTKTGQTLSFDHDEWRTFLKGAKADEFDV